MKKILFILSFFVSFVSFGQIYQLMPQYGYQTNRMNFDSTLQIPTTCGVPTLKSVVNVKRAAIAFDSCNNRFYQYNPKTSAWSVIGGGSTPSLQAVTDVGNTTDKSIIIGVGGQQGLLNLNTWNNDSYRNKFIDYNGQTELFGGGYFQVIDSFSKNMSIQFGNTNGGSETSNYIGQKSSLLNTNVPTIELNSINKSILITPDEQLYKNDASNSLTLIPDYFGYNDTLNYPRNNGVKDTIATIFDVRQKLNISDTTNKWVTSVTKLNDSTIRVVKNTTTTDITLTPAATVTAATRLVTTVYNNSGSTITKGSVVYINGRHSSNLPTIALAQANTEQNSYSTFALVQDDILNNNSGTAIQAGNITNLNLPTSSYTDGEVVYLSATVAGGITTNKNSVLAPNHIVKIGTITRAHPTAGGIEIKIENGWQLDELSDVQIPAVPNDSTLLQFSRVDSLWHSVSVNNAIGTKYIKPSDTATMLNPYLRKVDTASLSNRINLKLNISDTAGMLTKYLRKTDTASLSNRIDLRVRYSDTATMLTPYLRKIDTASLSSRINLKFNISDTATMLSPYQRANTAVKYSDTTSLIATKTNLLSELNLSDTAAMLSPYARTNVVNAGLAGKQNTLTLTTTGTSGAATLVGSTLNIPQYSGGGGTPGGATGNVQFNSSGAFAGSNNLFWDNTNARLGIGTTSPTVNLNVVSSTNTGITARNTSTSGRADLLVTNDAGNVGGFTIYGSAFGAPFSNNVAVTSFKSLGMYTDGGVINGGTSTMDFITGGYNNSPTMRITGGNTGNVLIGTTTDAGFKLDVNGTARASTSLQTPTLLGNTTSGGTLTLQSTSNATKGKLLFGTSAYDEVNNRLGIGTASPTSSIQVDGTSTINPIIALNASATNTRKDQYFDFRVANTSKFLFGYTQDIANRFFIYNNAIAGAPDAIRIYESTDNVAIGHTTVVDAGYKFDVNGTARVQGAVNFNPTNTAAGTTGNRTINKASGTVNIAAAGTTVTVTNSLVTANSIVFAVIRTNDATATIKNVVPSAGSFTINLNAAATAETSIGFFVIN